MESVQEQIDINKKKLLPVINPVQVQAGSIEVDEQLLKLSYNLKVLTNLYYISSNESINLEYVLNKKMFDLSNKITEPELQEFGVVKSDKFRYLKYICADEIKSLEEMRNMARYFQNMIQTYMEWINVYKKIRTHES